MSRPETPALRRFEQLVRIGADDDCWPWVGKAHYKYGYGAFYMGKGIYVGAHRAAWTFWRGPIPAGRHVLHHCDYTACVNPAHLFIGSQGDNVRDAAAKGRIRGPRLCGVLNPAAILTSGQVRQIRNLHKQGRSQTALAAQFGVSLSTVNAIVRRRTWAGVP